MRTRSRIGIAYRRGLYPKCRRSSIALAMGLPTPSDTIRWTEPSGRLGYPIIRFIGYDKAKINLGNLGAIGN